MSLSTRQTIRQAIGRDNGWLIAVGSCSSNGAAGGTTLIDNTLLYSTVRNQFIKARDVAASVQSGDATRGQRRFITGPPSSAGVIAVSPAFSAQIDQNDDYEVWEGNGPHPDEIDRCIDKALAEACWYWRLSPITMIRGGDGEEDLVVDGSDLDALDGTTIWSGTNCTPAVSSPSFPDEYIRNTILLAASASPGYLESIAIDVDPNEKNWRISAFIRSFRTGAFDSDDARLVIVDKTNSDAIIPATTNPLRTTVGGWRLVKSNFIIPDGCQQIAIRLQVQTILYYGEFGAIQLYHRDRTVFSMERRITTKKQVGSLVVLTGDDYRQLKRNEWSGTLERREVSGRGVSLEINPSIGENMLWFYEKVSFPNLTTSTPAATDDDNETWAAEEWIKNAASFYCYEYLKKRDNRIAPDRWRSELRDARELLEVIQDDYGIEPMYVDDSPRRTRRAVRRV